MFKCCAFNSESLLMDLISPTCMHHLVSEFCISHKHRFKDLEKGWVLITSHLDTIIVGCTVRDLVCNFQRVSLRCYQIWRQRVWYKVNDTFYSSCNHGVYLMHLWFILRDFFILCAVSCILINFFNGEVAKLPVLEGNYSLLVLSFRV